MRAVLLLLAVIVPVFNLSAQNPDGREMYESLRNMVLETKAADLGIRPPNDGRPHVYGIVMDVDIDGETATVVAFDTGDASLYLSSGSGTIGGGAHPTVVRAARHFVATARLHADAATPTSQFPRPGSEQVNFYLITTQGVLRATRPKDHLVANSDALAPLFYAGNGVLTELFRIDNSR